MDAISLRSCDNDRNLESCARRNRRTGRRDEGEAQSARAAAIAGGRCAGHWEKVVVRPAQRRSIAPLQPELRLAALWPGTTPTPGLRPADAAGATGDRLMGVLSAETCRNSIDCPAPVSMARRFTGVRSDDRTMCGISRKTISSFVMWWSFDPNRYFNIGIELKPGNAGPALQVLLVQNAAQHCWLRPRAGGSSVRFSSAR